MFQSDGKTQLEESLDVVKALAMTRAEKEARRAELHYWGLQYEDLVEWYEEAPLRERKPCSRVRITAEIVNKMTAHLFGASNVPTWRVSNGGENEKIALNEMIKESKLIKRYSELGRIACLTGTVALAFHVFESGRIDSEVIRAESCQPLFGKDNYQLATQYGLDFDDLIYLDEYSRDAITDPETGEERFLLKRREWKLNETIVYKPIDLKNVTVLDAKAKAALKWRVDENASVRHDLGFIPVVWIRLIEISGSVFGAPLLTDAEFDLEDEINYTLSQAGRAVRYASEPTEIFYDVKNLDASLLKTGSPHTLRVDSDGMPGGKQARVEFLEMQGTGQEVAMQHIDVLRKAIYSVACIVVQDPEKHVGALSGTALKILLEPMVTMIEDLRPSFEEGIGLFLHKLMKVRGYDVTVSAKWPSILPLTTEEFQQLAMIIGTLRQDGLITRRSALEMLSPYIGITDVDAYLNDIARDSYSTMTVEDDNGFADRMKEYQKHF